MARVLVVATSRKTRGGITSVVKAHEMGQQWKDYHCCWIETHRDGPAMRKIAYFCCAFLEFLILLPFYDIVHCHVGLDTSVPRKRIFATLGRICGKKIIIHFHPSNETQVRDPKFSPKLKKLFDLADKVIVLSPMWERILNEVFPESHYDISVLYNPCPKVQRTGIPRKKQILYAGTILKRKGYDVLLRGFSQIAKDFPEWKVAFAGNPYFENGINEIETGKHLASELDITNQVEWLGWINGVEKDRVFNESSVYCLASEGEGFPMGVLDAWAYGIPCVMTPVGGIPDIVNDGIEGLLFTVGDEYSLAEQLRKLMSNEELCKSIVEETDKFVYGEFEIQHINHQLGFIYNSVSRTK